jgi:hypothetical protein
MTEDSKVIYPKRWHNPQTTYDLALHELDDKTHDIITDILDQLVSLFQEGRPIKKTGGGGYWLYECKKDNENEGFEHIFEAFAWIGSFPLMETLTIAFSRMGMEEKLVKVGVIEFHTVPAIFIRDPQKFIEIASSYLNEWLEPHIFRPTDGNVTDSLRQGLKLNIEPQTVISALGIGNQPASIIYFGISPLDEFKLYAKRFLKHLSVMGRLGNLIPKRSSFKKFRTYRHNNKS